jgi:hypothetical protein
MLVKSHAYFVYSSENIILKINSLNHFCEKHTSVFYSFLHSDHLAKYMAQSETFLRARLLYLPLWTPFLLCLVDGVIVCQRILKLFELCKLLF